MSIKIFLEMGSVGFDRLSKGSKAHNRLRTIVLFYVLLTVHPCIILQINPTRCTILFNIFIYFSSPQVSGKCDTGTCSVATYTE